LVGNNLNSQAPPSTLNDSSGFRWLPVASGGPAERRHIPNRSEGTRRTSDLEFRPWNFSGCWRVEAMPPYVRRVRISAGRPRPV
jgi:hypothetical protein